MPYVLFRWFIRLLMLSSLSGVFFLASSFRFDNLWPALLIGLTSIAAFAGLLLSLAPLLEESAEREVILRAARHAIFASVWMAISLTSMAIFYYLFVVGMRFKEVTSDDLAGASLWGMFAIIPVLLMAVSLVWTINAGELFLGHYRRMHLRFGSGR